MAGYSDLNEHEKQYVRTHPINAFYIKNNRDSAFRETERLFGLNGHNDRSDAFRHCYWSALLARDIGYHDTVKFTTFHEMRPGNPLTEKQMDLHNNKIGAGIGRNGGSDAILSRQCLECTECREAHLQLRSNHEKVGGYYLYYTFDLAGVGVQHVF